MSNGYSNYASYTELSSLSGETETSQTVENLTVTGQLILANPLEVAYGGTEARTEDGARQSLNAASSIAEANFVYTEGETAVGTWIDGKTIYRQYFSGTPTSAGTAIAVGTIANFKELVKIEHGCVDNGTQQIALPLAGSASTDYNVFYVINSTNTVMLKAGVANLTYHSFLYYTKTT